jgi:iron(III) transport system substrate-binding protein
MSKFYGFSVKLNLIGGSHTVKAAELALAARNNVPSGIDVFWTSYTTSVKLIEAGVVQKFDWIGALGIDPGARASEYGVKSHDVSLIFITYNTNLVPAAAAPTAYTDLRDPKWKGRIALPRTPSPWVYLTVALGEEAAAALLSDLMTKQDAKILPTYPDVVARVVSGEFAIGLGTEAFTEMRKGAPIRMADVNPLPLSSWAFYLMKDVRHPNLAKLWAYWIASPDGQKALAEVDGTGFVTTEGTDLWKLAHDNKVVWLTEEFAEKESERLSKRFAAIMGLK